MTPHGTNLGATHENGKHKAIVVDTRAGPGDLNPIFEEHAADCSLTGYNGPHIGPEPTGFRPPCDDQERRTGD